MPDFRPCSACRPHSQAPLRHYTPRPDFHPGWGNLWAPPLPFGRRPPQSNYPPATVPTPDNGAG